MKRKLYTLEQVIELIKQGRHLVLSGDEKILNKLPKGNWIAGTIPYFMDETGGAQSDELIFVDDQTEYGIDFSIKQYSKDNFYDITKENFDNGFSIVIIPAGSATHVEFSVNALNIPDIFLNPLTGFISGLNLDLLGEETAKVYLGTTQEKLKDGMVVLNVRIPDEQTARVEIINIFHEEENSDILTFPKTGFAQTECFVNGERKPFAEYLNSIDYDIRFPIMTNQTGAIINKCFQGINKETKEVSFYAPVFEGEEYRFSHQLNDYKAAFDEQTAKVPDTNYACNCILNYLYGDFENNKIDVTGATTFGEIGYQLLNKTLVYMVIE